LLSHVSINNICSVLLFSLPIFVVAINDASEKPTIVFDPRVRLWVSTKVGFTVGAVVVCCSHR
jgi:hypothetical protein